MERGNYERWWHEERAREQKHGKISWYKRLSFRVMSCEKDLDKRRLTAFEDGGAFAQRKTKRSSIMSRSAKLIDNHTCTNTKKMSRPLI